MTHPILVKIMPFSDDTVSVQSDNNLWKMYKTLLRVNWLQ